MPAYLVRHVESPSEIAFHFGAAGSSSKYAASIYCLCPGETLRQAAPSLDGVADDAQRLSSDAAASVDASRRAAAASLSAFIDMLYILMLQKRDEPDCR